MPWGELQKINMEVTPNMENGHDLENINDEEREVYIVDQNMAGQVKWWLIWFFVGFAFWLGTVIWMYKWVHTENETASYRFVGMKSNFRDMQAICIDNLKTAKAKEIWFQQNHPEIKPPPELQVLQECVVEKEKGEK